SMRAPAHSVTATLVACAALCGPLAAQSGPRSGFWFSAGFGYGSANVSCDGCIDSSRVGGTSGFLRIGGTLNPHLRLGGTVEAWTHTSGDVMETLGNLTFSAYYYPNLRKNGLFLEGGVGLSTYRANTSPDQITGTGFGLTVAVGYDYRVGTTIWLTPRAAYSYGAVGTLSYASAGDTYATGWK